METSALDGSTASFPTIAPETGSIPASAPAPVLPETTLHNDGIAPLAPKRGIAARLAWPCSLAFAFALHAGLALALLPSRDLADLGDGGVALEAVSVDMIEQVPTFAAPTIAGADAVASDSEASARTQQATAETAPPRTDEPVETTERTVPEAASPAPMLTPAEPSPAREVLPEPAIDAKPPVETVKEASPPPSEASPLVVGSIAVAEASPGVVSAYGTELARIISKGRPKASETRNLKGRVVVEFVVGTAGGLQEATVRSSSGNDRLDALAITSLKRLSFPPPPPQMSLRQRTIIQPFEFR